MRTELAPLQKAASGYGRQIRRLEKASRALERMVKRQSKSTNGAATDELDEESAHRFSAKGVSAIVIASDYLLRRWGSSWA